MSQDGYTLAETLAALLIIGLAIGGLTEGMRVIGLMQTAAARTAHETQGLRQAQQALGGLLDAQGPFRSDERDRFVGDVASFDFDCGTNVRCGARLVRKDGAERLLVTRRDGDKASAPLLRVSDARFSYGDGETAAPDWPPEPGRRHVLKSVTILGRSTSGEVPVATARLWVEQAPGCQFDPIAQDCREASR